MNSLIREVIKAYNRTKELKDKMRPLKLKRILNKALRDYPEAGEAGIFISRVLSAHFLRFEIIRDSNMRFEAPAFIKFKHPGFGFLNILCRVTADLSEADFWFQFSHIPADGVPMQEVLNDLKRGWGSCGKLKFPVTGSQENKSVQLCSTDNHSRSVYHIGDFVDFRPLLRLRRELNIAYANKTPENVTLAALLVWRLAHDKAFDEVKFAIPVDLEATVSRERTLGFIFIRPSAYFDKDKPGGGFLKFQRDFNRKLRDTRKRMSASYKLLESYALLAPVMYAFTTKCLRKPLSEFVGTIGVTIIKQADLFIAPSSDVHTEGFIAISNYFISTEDEGKVCHISIKGPKDKIKDYLEIIKEIAAGNPK